MYKIIKRQQFKTNSEKIRILPEGMKKVTHKIKCRKKNLTAEQELTNNDQKRFEALIGNEVEKVKEHESIEVSSPRDKNISVQRKEMKVHDEEYEIIKDLEDFIHKQGRDKE